MLYYGLTWRPRTDNLGDDLVTLAALQHLPRVDSILDADAPDAPIRGLQDGDRLVTLVTGVFLRSSAHWPPEEHMAPACVGVHISQEDAWGLPLRTLDGAGLECLRACAPIAARDLRTARRLEKLDIPHSVTGCMSLLLKHPDVPRKGVVCCDVPEEVSAALRTFRPDVTEVTHHLDHPSEDFTVRMDAARALLTAYASAEMVFTRRLHCAMACLAVGTPVLWLYHPEYEDLTRFAPMDGMVRRQPVEAFLQEIQLHGLPAPWRNPADMGKIQRELTAALQSALRRAEEMPLPLIDRARAETWRRGRVSRMMESAAAKITKLENQHYEDLRAKFDLLAREDSVKTTFSGLLTLPEVLEALRTASLRRQLEALPAKEQKAFAAEYRKGAADTDDLVRQAMEAIELLGWPEGSRDN